MGYRLVVTLLLSTAPVAAAERTHTVVPEDYFSLATVTEVAVSPFLCLPTAGLAPRWRIPRTGLRAGSGSREACKADSYCAVPLLAYVRGC